MEAVKPSAFVLVEHASGVQRELNYLLSEAKTNQAFRMRAAISQQTARSFAKS
jgi:hypothetical protein